jgi:hypothetical protein
MRDKTYCSMYKQQLVPEPSCVPGTNHFVKNVSDNKETNCINAKMRNFIVSSQRLECSDVPSEY